MDDMSCFQGGNTSGIAKYPAVIKSCLVFISGMSGGLSGIFIRLDDVDSVGLQRLAEA